METQTTITLDANQLDKMSLDIANSPIITIATIYYVRPNNLSKINTVDTTTYFKNNSEVSKKVFNDFTYMVDVTFTEIKYTDGTLKLDIDRTLISITINNIIFTIGE